MNQRYLVICIHMALHGPVGVNVRDLAWMAVNGVSCFPFRDIPAK